MKNRIFISFLMSLVSQAQLNAQCAMCKAVVEANLESGDTKGAGLNDGILFLMAMPYIAVLIFGVFYYIQKQKKLSA